MQPCLQPLPARRPYGFSLIELMVVLVIIGILAALAYPSYTDHVRETRRTDAQGTLTQIAAFEEKYFAQCNSYTINLGGSMGVGCDDATSGLGFSASGITEDGNYSLAVVANNPDDAADDANTIATFYFVTATPVDNRSQDGDGKLGLSATGIRFWDKDDSDTFDAGEETWKKR